MIMWIWVSGFYCICKKNYVIFLCSISIIAFQFSTLVTWQKNSEKQKRLFIEDYVICLGQFKDESTKSNITSLTMAVSQVIEVAFN